MQSLQNLSDYELLLKTEKDVAEERKSTLEVLHDFREIERRRLHIVRGFSSLHEFCVKHLGYSDGAAHRRVQAMRLLNAVPEAEKQIEDGTLSLSTACTLQNFFQNEKKTQNKTYDSKQKLELITEVQNKSRRECEKTLAAISPQSVPKLEKEKVLTSTETLISFTVTDEFMNKFRRLKELSPHMAESYAKAFEKLMDMALTKLDPEKKESKPKAASPEKLSKMPTKLSTPPEKLLSKPLTRYIAAATKQIVWKRDQGLCSYIDPITKRRCQTRYGLQIDHIIPWAKGGASTPENLRLLCRAHNQLAARQHFGNAKIDSFAGEAGLSKSDFVCLK